MITSLTDSTTATFTILNTQADNRTQKNIAAAKVAGIKDSLRLTDTQYETAVSILFIGYIIMQIPSNVYLAQIRPSIFIPICVVVWGAMSAATGAVTNLSGLYAIRFFLGIVEAAFLRMYFGPLHQLYISTDSFANCQPVHSS